jgi:cysteine-rich repeat protein
MPATGCGDRMVEASEACDDGNTSNGDGCSATCKPELGFACGDPWTSAWPSSCGDGIKASNEECDPGSSPSRTCGSDCKIILI